MQLQPRHNRLINYLSERSPTGFGVDELAAKLILSRHTLANELPKLANEGYVRRRAVGRTFDYYIDKTPSRYMPIARTIEPYSQANFGILFQTIIRPDYTPALTKLDWSIPFTVAHLARAAATGDLSQQPIAKKALESFLEALEATELACRKLLATPQLWDAALPNWLTAGLTEASLEKLLELTSQATQRWGRLEPSAPTTKEL
jgi:DNA-binding MarR family transcriptional regulator